MSQLHRTDALQRVRVALKRSPVVALLGPRQCGKTTLARDVEEHFGGSFFDLENPRDLMRLENAQLVLERLRGIVILDEIQRRPDLLPLLRVLADRRPLPARFLLLGSASPDLIRHSSETLAGRVEIVELGGFSLDEVGTHAEDRLWLRGGFPRSFLARSESESLTWREDFVRTFLERDLMQLGVTIPAVALRRFWTMTAHYHGQVWNGSEIGASLGVAHTTVRRYLDLLTGAYVLRQLPPWFENIGKRLVKSPKVYVRDAGLLHVLLNLPRRADLESHPKFGASWEGFALEEVLRRVGSRNAYFWATHGGAELDLLVHLRGKRWGFEFKCHDAPGMTKSLHSALADLKLTRAWIVHPGRAAPYPVHERVTCIGLSELGRVCKLITR
jgi:predicted AAA+ superfamily ATPase